MEPLVIPAGTTVSLRTVGRIDAGGQSFGVVLASDLPGIISGSPARVVIVENRLALSAVMRNGMWYAVQPDEGTVQPVGGGAPLGTLVRGVLDVPNPQGNTAIVAEGPRIRIPAGAILIFRLDTPARVTVSVPSPSGT